MSPTADPDPSNPRPVARPRLVLVGPPGAGKSAVGALAAERLSVPFVDTDAILAERSGTTVGELFIDLGEDAFRALEEEVVAAALAADGVVALGSGAVERATARLERYVADGGTVVFLDVSLAAGMPRVGLNAPRSVALGSPRAQFSSMAARRRPLYERTASAVIDTSKLTIAEVAATVVDRV